MTVGKTQDAGWQIGVSRTLDAPLEDAWATLVEQPEVWLGAGAQIPNEVGAQWQAADGTAGELRSRREGDRLRLTLRPPDADHETTVQVAVRAAGSRTSVRFHQERMLDAGERAKQRAHWQGVLDRLAEALDG